MLENEPRRAFNAPDGHPWAAFPTSVYVITDDLGMCKIGVSRTPENRLAQLQSASPRKLRLTYTVIHTAPLLVEQEAHRILKKHWTQGEWFCCNPSVAEAAVDLAANRIGRPIVDLGSVEDIRPRNTWIWWLLGFAALWGFFVYVISGISQRSG